MGSVLGYEPDRSTARKCAEDLTDILSELFDWMIAKQKVAAANPALACKAKVSVIAHSMGNYVLQKAMAAAWTRKNQPLLVTLINQLIMVAADVDNVLFDAGAADNDDGDAMSRIWTYRITTLYSGRDDAYSGTLPGSSISEHGALAAQRASRIVRRSSTVRRRQTMSGISIAPVSFPPERRR